MKTESEVRRGAATRRAAPFERGARPAGEAVRVRRAATARTATATEARGTPGARARTATRRAAAPATAPARPRPARPSRPPRPDREVREVREAPAGKAVRPGRPRPARRSHPPRAPFVLLLVGLLCGGLVTLLLLNTVLAQDSFRAGELREENRRIAEAQERTRNANARLGSPENLDRQGRRHGVNPDDSPPQFVTPAPAR